MISNVISLIVDNNATNDESTTDSLSMDLPDTRTYTNRLTTSEIEIYYTDIVQCKLDIYYFSHVSIPFSTDHIFM